MRRTVKLFTPQYIPFSCLRWFRISLSFMNLELYGHFGLETMAFGSSDPLNLQKETSLSPDDDDREKLASMGSRSGLEWIPKVWTRYDKASTEKWPNGYFCICQIIRDSFSNRTWFFALLKEVFRDTWFFPLLALTSMSKGIRRIRHGDVSGCTFTGSIQRGSSLNSKDSKYCQFLLLVLMYMNHTVYSWIYCRVFFIDMLSISRYLNCKYSKWTLSSGTISQVTRDYMLIVEFRKTLYYI